jgi:hypothetical protein
MDAMDLPEGDGRWFCPGCTQRKVFVHLSIITIQPERQTFTRAEPTTRTFIIPTLTYLAAVASERPSRISTSGGHSGLLQRQ